LSGRQLKWIRDCRKDGKNEGRLGIHSTLPKKNNRDKENIILLPVASPLSSCIKTNLIDMFYSIYPNGHESPIPSMGAGALDGSRSGGAALAILLHTCVFGVVAEAGGYSWQRARPLSVSAQGGSSITVCSFSKFSDSP
jgi:hypothetical protein